MIPVRVIQRWQKTQVCRNHEVCGHKPEIGEIVYRSRNKYTASKYYCVSCKREMEY